MLLEDILLAAAIGIAVLLFGLPLVRFLKAAQWRQKDPLAEAKERLRIAQLEAEAARVNREAERIYEKLYEDTLTDRSATDRARVATREEGAEAAGDDERQRVEPPLEKGKRHGQG